MKSCQKVFMVTSKQVLQAFLSAVYAGLTNLHLTSLSLSVVVFFVGSAIQILNFKLNKNATTFIFCLSLFVFNGELQTVKQDHVTRPWRLSASFGLCKCYAAFTTSMHKAFPFFCGLTM